MSANVWNARLLEGSNHIIPDPGVGGTVRCDSALNYFEFKIASTGARIVAPPSVEGQRLTVATSGAPSSSCSLSFTTTGIMANGTTSYNAAGAPATLNSITFNGTDEFAELVAVKIAAGLRWALVLTCGGAAA